MYRMGAEWKTPGVVRSRGLLCSWFRRPIFCHSVVVVVVVVVVARYGCPGTFLWASKDALMSGYVRCQCRWCKH